MQRLLLRFVRRGDLKYLSHLEMSRAVARAMRRAGLPVAFSQGFNPHPRLSFWHALPVGVEAQEELAEVWLSETVTVYEVMSRLNAVLPPGMEILEVSEVCEDEPRLTRRFTHALYVIRVAHAEPPLQPEEAILALRKGLAPEDGEIINIVARTKETEICLLASHREEGPRLRKLVRKTADCLEAGGQSATIVRKGLYRSRESAIAGSSGLI